MDNPADAQPAPRVNYWRLLWLADWLCAAAFFAIPLVIYAYGRAAGSIPDPAAWRAAGNNHGPWQFGVEPDIFLFCSAALLVLAAYSLLHGIVLALTRREWAPAGKGFAAALAQLFLFVIQSLILFWTID